MIRLKTKKFSFRGNRYIPNVSSTVHSDIENTVGVGQPNLTNNEVLCDVQGPSGKFLSASKRKLSNVSYTTESNVTESDIIVSGNL